MCKRKHLAIILTLLAGIILVKEALAAAPDAGEKIVYTILPFGAAEYNDLGTVELDGKIAHLVTFKTQALGFNDTEKIYSIGESLSPLKVERDVTKWLGKEYLVEKYDADNFTLTIEKFKHNRKIKEYHFKSDGPIYNAILLGFYLRRVPEPNIGWTFEARIPEKFRIILDSIEEVEVPAGKFMAYHFKSSPNKFEAWVSKDNPRTLLKIKGRGGLMYSVLMEEHILDAAAKP